LGKGSVKQSKMQICAFFVALRLSFKVSKVHKSVGVGKKKSFNDNETLTLTVPAGWQTFNF
jgi:hypothetical protein